MKKVLFIILSLLSISLNAQKIGTFDALEQWWAEGEEGLVEYSLIRVNDSIAFLDLQASDLIFWSGSDSAYPGANFLFVIPDSLLSGYSPLKSFSVIGSVHIDGEYSSALIYNEIGQNWPWPSTAKKPGHFVRIEHLSFSPVVDETELTFKAQLWLKKDASQARIGQIQQAPIFAPVSLANITVYQNRMVATSPQRATIQVVRLDNGEIQYSNLFVGQFTIDFVSLKPGFYSALVIEQNGSTVQKKFTVK